MSELIYKTLESIKYHNDYEGLLSSLVIAKNTIDSKDNKVIGVGKEIIKKLLKSFEFKDIKIYYYDKCCNIIHIIWQPELNECIKLKCDIYNFKEVSETLSKYLVTEFDDYDEYMIVLDSFCDILKQIIFFIRALKKYSITII